MTNPRRYPARKRGGPTIAAIAILAAVAFAQEPTAADRGPHGAATVARQQAALDVLLAGRSLTDPPPGVDPVAWKRSIPEDNTPTAERIALGRKLFFDARLSRDDSVACATCHDVTRGFTDQRMVSEGIEGKLGRRSAPTIMNVYELVPAFWDGRAHGLEQQATMPITNPLEMGMVDQGAVVKKLAAIAEYPPLFQQTYGRALNIDDVGRALAAFERTLVFLDAPFDRFARGQNDALTDSEKRGFDLFNGKGRCTTCHPMNDSNPLGTDRVFHNIGVAAQHEDFEGLAKKGLQALAANASEERLDQLALGTDLSELGRFMVTRNRSDIGAFKTPTIRNVGITGPYMHDGSLRTLWDVIDHYNKGGVDNLYLDGGIEALALTEPETDDLVAFMFALTDDRFAAQNKAAFTEQQGRAKTDRPHRDQDAAQRRRVGFESRVMKKTEAPK